MPSENDMTEGPSQDPHSVYDGCREARRRVWEKRKRSARRISNARLAVFGLGVVVAWLVWESRIISPWWMTLPLAVFGLLLVLHDKVIRAGERAKRAEELYEKGLARLEDRWAGTGDPGLRFLDESHPYARDLDLFGTGSLYELLATTRTCWGAKTLAEWLCAPPSPDVIRARQAAVADLRPRLDLREDLAAAGDEISDRVNPEALPRWAAAPSLLGSRLERFAAFALATAAIAMGAAWLFDVVGRLPVLVVLTAELGFALWLRERVRQVILSVERPGRELALLSKILGRMEREPFQSPRLVELQRSLTTGGVTASRQIRRLHRLTEWLDARRNNMFAPLAALLLWGTQFAFALEAWRRSSGAAVERWLAAIGELEALVALATHTYENPENPFPEIVEVGPVFEGEALGHPLIPKSHVVRNDLRLGGDKRLFVVSGSNMSGKSTLLRTVGTNTVLALAGAPVRAERLKVSRLALGASIRIVDSLQEGISRFYAEIKRLRQIMDLARGSFPLVFLLDEILHGTNSHDRRIGAEAVVRGLVERGAVGLITTHDLALSRVADSLAPRAANVHFEDHLEDGKMVFDYRLRGGVVQKSNALDLMRSVGLEV